MADKIPIYGELDCRTAENIIADAKQIRYDATKNVKEKIEEIETSGGGGGVDKEKFDSTTAGILQQICAIADTPIDEMTQITLSADSGDVIYINKLNSYESGYLSLGIAMSDQTFIPLSTTDYLIDSYAETLNIQLPCVIRSYKLRDGTCGWEIQQVKYGSIRKFVKSIYIAANNSTVILLPVAIGAYSNDKGGHWSTSLGGKVEYKLIRPTLSIMPKFEIRNISSGNAQVIDQYTVCEKYGSIYYRATHYFKLKATSTSGKIHLGGNLVLTNGAISVHTYVQELFGFATFAGIDTSSTSDNDYALSVTTTRYETPDSWDNNTNIAKVVIDSNSMFDASGDKINIMIVVLFKSSDL